MSTRKARRRPKTPQAPVPSLAERMQEERERLFKAMSIIACCRLACASLLRHGGDLELTTDALQAAYDFIDATAGELERAAGEFGEAPETSEPSAGGAS